MTIFCIPPGVGVENLSVVLPFQTMQINVVVHAPGINRCQTEPRWRPFLRAPLDNVFVQFGNKLCWGHGSTLKQDMDKIVHLKYHHFIVHLSMIGIPRRPMSVSLSSMVTHYYFGNLIDVLVRIMLGLYGATGFALRIRARSSMLYRRQRIPKSPVVSLGLGQLLLSGLFR